MDIPVHMKHLKMKYWKSPLNRALPLVAWMSIRGETVDILAIMMQNKRVITI